LDCCLDSTLEGSGWDTDMGGMGPPTGPGPGPGPPGPIPRPPPPPMLPPRNASLPKSQLPSSFRSATSALKSEGKSSPQSSCLTPSLESKVSKKSVSDLMRPLPVAQLLGGPLPPITGFLSSTLEGVVASLSEPGPPPPPGRSPGPPPTPAPEAGVPGVELSQLLLLLLLTMVFSPFTSGASGSALMEGGLAPAPAPAPGSSFTREALAWAWPGLGLTLLFTSFFIMFCKTSH